MPETNIIQQFVQKQVGVTIEPDEQDELYTLVEDRFKDVLLDALSTAQLEELNQRLQSGMTDAESQEFFLNAGVNYQPLLEQALAELEQELVADQERQA